MDIHIAMEESYKNGYVKGYKDGKSDSVVVVLCKNCANKEPSAIREKVWCKRMGRYMKKDGFCSEGV